MKMIVKHPTFPKRTHTTLEAVSQATEAQDTWEAAEEAAIVVPTEARIVDAGRQEEEEVVTTNTILETSLTTMHKAPSSHRSTKKTGTKTLMNKKRTHSNLAQS